jgi:hypothetical protein
MHMVPRMTDMNRFITLALVAAIALVPAAAIAKKKSPSSVKLQGGGTTLALDADTAKVLTEDLGLTLGVLKPGKSTDAGLRFPVTPSKLNAKTLAGTIKHRGGISISSGDTKVALRNFHINIDDAPDLTAKVGGTRLSILDLDLSGATIDVTKKRVKVTGVAATLTQGAADALNGAFGTDALAGGIDIGVADVNAKIKKGGKR